MTAKAAGRRNPKTFLSHYSCPIGDPFADFLNWFYAVVRFVDDAGSELHALWHILERFALKVLEEVFDLEHRYVDDAFQPLQNFYPGRAV